jgi:hypothetical protein
MSKNINSSNNKTLYEEAHNRNIRWDQIRNRGNFLTSDILLIDSNFECNVKRISKVRKVANNINTKQTPSSCQIILLYNFIMKLFFIQF